jgi:hypothetical protein
MTAELPDDIQRVAWWRPYLCILRWCLLAVLVVSITGAGLNMYWAEPQGLETGIPSPGGWDYTGIMHVHTKYSDGSGTFQNLADAAVDARADFVFTADHNTVEPISDGAEGWYGDILIASGTEVTYEGGHYLYFSDRDNMRTFNFHTPRRPLDNPLYNELTFLSHPVEGSHPNTDWKFTGLTGIEIVNGNVAWRDDSITELLPSFPWYGVFQSPLNILVDRPDRTIAVWDSLLQYGPCVALGAVDAHARIPLTDRHFLAFPSYSKAFRFVRTHLVTEAPLSENYNNARRTLLSALQTGRGYIEIGDFSDPRGFLFQAGDAHNSRQYSGQIAWNDSLELEVRIPLLSDATITLYCDGRPMMNSRRPQMIVPIEKSGVYRVEVTVGRKRFPWFENHDYLWILSNAIRVTQGVPGRGQP